MVRSIRLIAESDPESNHRWLLIAMGRVCANCNEVQVRWEFSDTTACTGPRVRPKGCIGPSL